MLTNHFANAPTVGNYENSSDELRARVHRLEQRLDNAEEQFTAKPKKGFRWKKFFKNVLAVVTGIGTILAFVPKTLNALARFKTACA